MAPTVFAGSPVPFDPAEIDKKLAAAHTLNTLAQTTNRVLFDLYDHCAVAKSVLLDRPAGHSRSRRGYTTSIACKACSSS